MFSITCDAGTNDYDVNKYKESFKKVTSLTQRGKSILLSKTITSPSNTKNTMADTQNANDKSNEEAGLLSTFKITRGDSCIKPLQTQDEVKQRSKSAARMISSHFEVSKARNPSELSNPHAHNSKSISTLQKIQKAVKQLQLNQDSNIELN